MLNKKRKHPTENLKLSDGKQRKRRRKVLKTHFKCLKITNKCDNIIEQLNLRGYSSVGRALEWHSRGRRFDPDYLHHLEPRFNPTVLFYEQTTLRKL